MKKWEKRFLITWSILLVMGVVVQLIMLKIIPNTNNLNVPDDTEVLLSAFICTMPYSLITIVYSRKYPIISYLLSSLPFYLLIVMLLVNKIWLPNIIRAALIILTLIITTVQLKMDNKNNEVSQKE